jgi:hypothetical protein
VGSSGTGGTCSQETAPPTPHIVVGSGKTDTANGNLVVTLTGGATFPGNSYQCTATYQADGTGTLALSISTQSATSFTIKGDTNRSIGFVCIGQ